MTYVVNESCIKCKLMDCVEVCPVDCFYEGENMLVILLLSQEQEFSGQRRRPGIGLFAQNSEAESENSRHTDDHASAASPSVISAAAKKGRMRFGTSRHLGLIEQRATRCLHICTG